MSAPGSSAPSTARGVRNDATAAWDSGRAAAIEFWHRTADLPGVLEVATELMAAPDARIRAPHPGVVAALTAARMGLEQQARHHAAAARMHGEEAQILTELIGQQLAASASP